jgi:spore coat protein E
MGRWNKSREIVTKAVCGKGRTYEQETHIIPVPHEPTGVLGAWMMNHRCEAQRVGEGVDVHGAYTMSVWYAYDRNSKTDVHEQAIAYTVHVPLQEMDEARHAHTEHVLVHVVQPPSCIDASIDEPARNVVVRVEWELTVELVADTKLRVCVCAEEEEKQKPVWDDVDEQLFESMSRYAPPQR